VGCCPHQTLCEEEAEIGGIQSLKEFLDGRSKDMKEMVGTILGEG